MKRILVVINNLDIGGIQESFVNFVNAISDGFKVDILVFSGNINPKYQILNSTFVTPSKKMALLGIPASKFSKNPWRLSQKFFFVFLARFFGGVFAHKLFFKGYRLQNEYDLAISFTQDNGGRSFAVGCNDFVRFCVRAKEKATFIHCDFRNYGGNDSINRRRYNYFDRIYCVSESCAASFVDCCPTCKDKTRVMRNVLDFKKIVSQSKLNVANPFKAKGIKFLFVGRLSREKGLDRMICQFSEYHKTHKNSELCIVGDGPLKKDVQSEITNLHLDDSVSFVGTQTNPYPYFLMANYLLLFSYNECAPMVIEEAEILGLPVISSDTLSAQEMLIRNNSGIVIKVFNKNSLTVATEQAEKLCLKMRSSAEIMERPKKTISIIRDFLESKD